MKKRFLILCLMLGFLCTGCDNEKVNDREYSDIYIEEENIEEIEKDHPETPAAEEENKIQDELNETEAAFDLFAEMKNREFYFSSGAGAWRTIMHVKSDGSFSGTFSDSDMGDTGEGYPKGTCYVCDFKGEFTKPVKVNDYTYSLGIAEISYEKEPGTEEIIDGILYRYDNPYGIEGTNSLLCYLPGAPLEELPPEYLDWVRYEVADVQDGKLPFYGIYNDKEQNGFSSYEISDPLEELLHDTEEAAKGLKTALEEEPLSQTEMNTKSYELYQVWDEALNTFWKELKGKLSEEKYQKILNEQRAWISEKEKAVEKAGAEFAGGSMEPLARNMEAAEYTEQRVYELYELLKAF